MAISNTKVTVWGAIGNTIAERQSVSLGLIGVVAGVVGTLVARDAKVSLLVLIYLAIFSLYLAAILIAALRNVVEDNSLSLPRVLWTMSEGAAVNQAILLLEPSPLFGSASLVSVYHRDKEHSFELLIGHGTVQTVQSDMKIQVKIDEWAKGNDQLVTAIKNNNQDTLRQLVVRPSVQRGSAEYYTPQWITETLLRRYMALNADSVPTLPADGTAEDDNG